MYVHKQSIVIAENSYMLRKGLVQIINQLAYVERMIELDETVPIPEQIANYNPDIVIISPMLLGTALLDTPRQLLGLKKDAHLVALIGVLISQQHLQQYDAVISINDTPETVIEKLKGLSHIKKSNSEDSEELSDREKEILITLVKGMSNKEIADYHNISIHTVITHRRNITRKLNIHSPSGLTVYAIVNKLIDLNDINQ